MEPRREQQKDRGEDRRDHGAAAEALDDAEEDEHGEAAARRAARARQGETGDCGEKERAQGEQLGQPAGQRDGDDLGDEIGGLDPAQAIEWNGEPGLDVGKRAGDDLDVENRHEHAEAHGEIAEPGWTAGRAALREVALVCGFGQDVTRSQKAASSSAAQNRGCAAATTARQEQRIPVADRPSVQCPGIRPSIWALAGGCRPPPGRLARRRLACGSF